MVSFFKRSRLLVLPVVLALFVASCGCTAAPQPLHAYGRAVSLGATVDGGIDYQAVGGGLCLSDKEGQVGWVNKGRRYRVIPVLGGRLAHVVLLNQAKYAPWVIDRRSFTTKRGDACRPGVEGYYIR